MASMGKSGGEDTDEPDAADADDSGSEESEGAGPPPLESPAE
jgi:hypothetical protein